MEGFEAEPIKTRPTDGSESPLNRTEKMSQAEARVSSVLSGAMEKDQVIRRIIEKSHSSFSGPEERGF